MNDNSMITDPCEPGTTEDTSHHVLKSIKILIEMSKRLKEKERESDSLRTENENLLEKIEKFEKSKNSDSHEKRFAMRKLEEAENRLKTRTEYFDKERSIFVRNMEEMRRRMEDSESFRRFNEKEIEELRKIIERIPSNVRMEAVWSPVEKETMETLKRENKEITNDLKSAEFQLTLLKSQQQMVADVLATEQKERETAENQVRDWKMLLEQQESQLYQEQAYIRVLEQETLEIDYLRSQNQILAEENLNLKLMAENQAKELEILSKNSEKSDKTESQLFKNLEKLTHRISELHEGRRLEQIPESLRSEAPPKFQSSETFYQIAKLLNIILAGHTVPPKLISDFWNFLVKRAELTEEVIEEKIREVEKMKGAEFQRVEEQFQKEKMTMKAEFDRLNGIKKMEKMGNETIPPVPDTNMSSLALRFNSQPAQPEESESVEAAVQKLKEIKKMAVCPRFSAPKSKSDDGVKNWSSSDMESEEHERSEAELRYKLRKIELELMAEKEENKMRLEKIEKSMKRSETREIRMSRSDVVYEGVVYHAHPEDPKDKNWVLNRFLKNDM
ncbi:hypothetical protein GCK72_016662 [Caenorhabditis remanei]|uniref:Uncharacterized protein n=1 Tax=Caenorhabditis remanei TaxID=31234 RepID=A0A6A5G5H0_CAERE|nr:hypothetical protein GCK72_016662 [Caenorhabditis remanei]KAF1750116.1 hypothetical protein GCK72_016662 [Caenorhabditis remanei]